MQGHLYISTKSYHKRVKIVSIQDTKQYSLSEWKTFCLWTFYNIILLLLQFFWWKYHTSSLGLYNNTMSSEKITVEIERWYNSSSTNTTGCHLWFPWSRLPILLNPKPHSSHFETVRIHKSRKNKFVSSTCLLKKISKIKSIEEKVVSVKEKKTLHIKESGKKLKTNYLKEMITLLFKYK